MRKGILVVAGAAFFFFGVDKIQGQEFRFNLPINLGFPINTAFSEEDPYLTADGKRLFFVREVGGNQDIYMSNWTDTGWSMPVNLGPNVNSGTHEWHPSLSPDGNKLYFTAYGRPGSLGGWDIWCSTWDSVQQQWGVAQNLGPVINTFGLDWTACIAYSGQSLYYATNGKSHPQGQALFISQWNGTSWTTPVPLPDNINRTATEKRPSLTDDERTMYFVRWNYYPRIYVSERNFDGTWSNPIELDSVINNGYPTSGPNITPDGRKLFFASARPDGMGEGDIWVAERIIPVVFGDLNLDGRITIADIMLELNKVFLAEPYPAEEEMGDLNCDGLFAPADIVLLLNKALLGTPFPCNI